MLPGNGVGVGVGEKRVKLGFLSRYMHEGDICSEEGLFLIYDFG